MEPRKIAAIAGSRNAGATLSVATPSFALRISPASPDRTAPTISETAWIRATRSPASRAASGLPPTASIRRPVGIRSSTNENAIATISR